MGCEDQDGDDLCDDTVYITDTVYVTVTDTVFVTDTVVVEDCTDEFTYYLNTIMWLDSALTVVVNNLEDCQEENEELETTLSDCEDAVQWNFDLVNDLMDEVDSLTTLLEEKDCTAEYYAGYNDGLADCPDTPRS